MKHGLSKVKMELISVTTIISNLTACANVSRFYIHLCYLGECKDLPDKWTQCYLLDDFKEATLDAVCKTREYKTKCRNTCGLCHDQGLYL